MYVPKKTLLASHRFTCNVSATFQRLWRRSSIYCYICYLWTNTYRLGNWQLSRLIRKSSLREKCPYLELFWSAFRRIGTKYGEIPRISPYSVRMLEKTVRNYYEYGHFLLSVCESYFLIVHSWTAITCWRLSGVFIVNFEHISHLLLVFLLFISSR